MKLNLSKISISQMIDFLKAQNYSSNLPRSAVLYGAYHADELVGVFALYKTAWHTTEIRGLCVKQELRRKGVGSRLIKEAVELIETPLVAATIVIDNIASKKAFERSGFKPVMEFYNTQTKRNIVLYMRNK